MSDDLAIQLQRLYRDYYAGRLEFHDYRYRRGLLVDSLAPGILPEPADVTLPRENRSAQTTSGEGRSTAPARAASGWRFRWYYVLAACVIIVAAVAYFVTGKLEESEPAAVASRSVPARQAAPAEAAVDEVAEESLAPTAGQRLVQEFLDRQDWRAMSVEEFQESWTRLPESERILAKGAVWFQPLSESLAYELEEIREFSRQPDDDPQLDRLYKLALHLGLVELVPPGWMPSVPPTAVASADSPDSATSAPVQPRVTAKPEPSESSPPEPAGSDEKDVATATPAPIATAGDPADPQAGNANTCTAGLLQTRRRNCYDVLGNGDNGPVMRVLPAGEVGVPGGSIAVQQPFAISLFEVTAGEFRRFCTAVGTACPDTPWSEEDMPVVNVSFAQAVAYGEWLSEQTGRDYRLPTAEEWEYAARGGASTDFPFGDELLPAQARFSSITDYDAPLPSSDRTTQRNGFGLWHVVGNVREWVDAGASGAREVRGGSYAAAAEQLRLSARESLPVTAGDALTGIRIVRELASD